MTTTVIAQALFFALCGFSFLLFEVSIVQLFTVFVGGPQHMHWLVAVGFSADRLFIGMLLRQ